MMIMMPIEDPAAVVGRIVEAANTDDLRAVDELFAPGFVDHDPGRGELAGGPEGVRQAWTMLRAAFPDLCVTVLDTVAEGDLVAVRAEMSGTHRGELMGLAATGNSVSVGVMDFNRVAGGQVQERWGQLDVLGLLQQLGAVPAAPRPNDDAPAVDRPSPLPRGAAAPDSSPAANKALAERFVEVVLNGHDLDAADDFLAPCFVGHIAGVPGEVRGIDAYREMFGAFLAAFPDYGETVHEVVASGDLVAARVTFGGTHRGEMFDVPATGKTVAAQAMAFLRFADHRIIELWTQADLLGLLAQLGVALGTADQAD
jgi:steroid delta-isomerase-like uncharacterized protein